MKTITCRGRCRCQDAPHKQQQSGGGGPTAAHDLRVVSAAATVVPALRISPSEASALMPAFSSTLLRFACVLMWVRGVWRAIAKTAEN